ncbi:MFS transporter [Lacisediminihabitans changchengi]|uniref:MFS transporter n=1 Tax=Lacisediminihabitans changchengi TaxID=2787634 RepID=A0A934SM24_9MICO|nr:MFS transporter [Lacisediminihabitans changchengi]MBK4346834.1 MFS transporter [Lacisediminihabitans changchengi]MBK4348043.1 MFS transporter [Lacisediminihabitans changchengi]
MALTDTAPRTAATPILFHRRRGRVLVLLCVMYFIAYFDRTNISAAGPSIIKEFGLTNAEFGLAASVFAIFYASLQIFGGWIGEKVGPRRGLLILGLLWGASTLFTGLAVGLVSLLIARAILGFSESATFPTATQAMSRWMPPDRNGFVQGIVHSASRLGTFAAPIVVTTLIIWSGWRESFFLVGVLSMLWAIVWFVMFRDRPRDMKGMTAQELSEVPAIPKAADRPPVPWKRLIRTILPVTLVDFGYGWVAWVFFTWIPTLLATVYKQDISKYGLLTSLILAGGVIGDTLGGVLSDRLLRKTGNARSARRTLLLIGFIGSALCLVPLVFSPPLTVAIVALAFSFFFLELTNAQLWSIPMDVAPTWSGTASGMMNTGFGVAGILSPIVVGALVDVTGDFVVPFAVSIGILVAATVLAGVMKPKRVDPIGSPLAGSTD